MPLTWPYSPVPLLTALGTRVRARLGIGLHVRRLRPLFLFESLGNSSLLANTVLYIQCRPRSHYSGGDAEKPTCLFLARLSRCRHVSTNPHNARRRGLHARSPRCDRKAARESVIRSASSKSSSRGCESGELQPLAPPQQHALVCTFLHRLSGACLVEGARSKPQLLPRHHRT